MTAVSKPNNRPPKAATPVLFNNTAFNFMPSPGVRFWFQGHLLRRSSNPGLRPGGWRPTLLPDWRSPQYPGWAIHYLDRAGTPPQKHRRIQPYPRLERDSRAPQYIARP